MNPSWLPLGGGIVPTLDQAGPLQEEERLATHQRALENARSEYQARRYDRAYAILGQLIPALQALADDPATPNCEAYALLMASSLVLKARLHWRRAERERELNNTGRESEERENQQRDFEHALKLFKQHQTALRDHVAESRLRTDFGIALYRTGCPAEAIDALKGALATGAPPAEAFGYLGMAHSILGTARKDPAHYSEAMWALKKGLQLAPRDKILLETLAITQEKAEEAELAVRTYCQAAIEAGNNEELNDARRSLEGALRLRPDDPQALSMLTLMLRSEGKRDDARTLLDTTLERFPGHPWALGLRGMLRQDEGKRDEALKDFHAARVDSPELAWIWLEHAKAAAERDPRSAKELLIRAEKLLGPQDSRFRQAQAEVAVRSALAVVGKTASRLLQGAVAWLTSSNIVRAVGEQVGGGYLEQLVSWARRDPAEMLEWIAKNLPNRVEPLEPLAKLYLERGDIQAAAAKVDEALRLAPESPSLLRIKAEVCRKQGNTSDALRFYLRAARLVPDDDEAFTALVSALVDAGRSDDALHEIDQKLARRPAHGPALACKGRLLVEARRFDESVTTLQRAEQVLPAGPNLLAVRITLGRAFRALNRYGDAGQAFDRAIVIDNELGDAHVHKALLLLDTAEYQAAAELLQEAIDRLPTDHEGYERRLGWLLNARAWALYCDGDTPWAELVSLFNSANQHAPDEPFTQKNLGQLLLRTPGREKEGRDILERLTELSVNQVPLSLVGWCHYRLGHYKAAEQWLRAAMAEDPQDAAAGFDLALVLLAEGASEACEAYAKAKACAARDDCLRQRGLFHIAALDVKQATEEAVIDRARGIARLQDLTSRLREAGFPEQRIAKLRPSEAALAPL